MNRAWRTPITGLAVALVLATGLAGPAQATVPGDNGEIAFRRYLDRERTTGAIFAVQPDGSGERQITVPPAGFIDDDPDWSPDGERLAFIRRDNSACGEDCVLTALYVVDADGSNLTRLLSSRPGVDCAFGGGCTFEPAWSPAGDTLAVSRVLGPFPGGEPFRSAIYLIDADGTRLTQVTQRGLLSTGVDEAPQFSPDGRTLAFERRNIRSARPLGGQAIWTVQVDGSHETRLTPYRLFGGDTTDWSPDGQRILFESNENGFENVSANIYTIGRDGTGLRQLTFARGGEVQHFASSYSPDGTRITFARSPGAGPDGYPDIYTMTVDGQDVRRVIRDPRWDSRPDWGSAG